MRYIRELDRTQVIEATHHTCDLWADGRTQSEHTAHNEEQLARAGADLLRYVGLVDDAGALVASSKRYSLAIRAPGGDALRTMGIGAVFVPDAHRGRDAARAMIRAMMDEARDLGDEAAWLYSDIGPTFYERLGFRAFPAFEHVALTRELPLEDPLGSRRVGDEDFPQIARAYNESFSSASVHPIRSPEALRYFLWRNRATAWLLEDGVREVGYLVTSATETEDGAPALWIDEWIAHEIPVDRVFATLRAIAEALGRERVASWLRPDRVVAPFIATRRARAIPMLATLRPEAWLSQIEPFGAHFGSLDHF